MAVCESVKSELEMQLAPGYTPPECAAPYRDREWLRARDLMSDRTIGGRMMIEHRVITVNDHLGKPETTADAIRAGVRNPQGRVTTLLPLSAYDHSENSC